MIKADALLAERLAYTTQHAIPLSEFLGWPEDDQDLTLAYLRLERAKCPGCGLTEEESANRTDPPYIADVHICQSCLELGRVENQISEKQRRAARIHWVPKELYVPPDERGG